MKRIKSSLSNSDVNTRFNAFMSMTPYHYITALPLKTVYRSTIEKNELITQGVHDSCKEVRLLDGLKVM
jgi:hypothetical protein